MSRVELRQLDVVDVTSLAPATIQPPAARRRGSTIAWGVIASTFLLAGSGRMFGFADVAALKTFTIVSSSIVIEALPFVMLGAVVSGVIEVFVSDATFLRLAKLPSRCSSLPQPSPVSWGRRSSRSSRVTFYSD